MFTPEGIHAILNVATPNLGAIVLLGINGGLGNNDLALLPFNALDMESGWLDYPRPKTGTHCRIPIWPETIVAVHAARSARRSPVDSDHNKLLFIGPRGQSYIGNQKGYRVTAEYNRGAKKAGVEGRTFYDLRRTFQTIAEGAHDLVAVQSIMGHAPASGDMSAIYRQGIADDRLLTVTNHVHAWLFDKPKPR